MTVFHYVKKVFYSVVCVLFLVSLQSCSLKTDPQKKDLFFETWKLRAQESRGYSPSPRKRDTKLPKAKLVKQAGKVSPEKPLPNQKVSLKMENENVGLVLRTLARGVGQNIMINSTVKGKINIDIKDAPWDESFKGVLHTNGLTYTWEGSIIRIMTLADMEHELKIKSIKEKQKTLELGIRQVEPMITHIIDVDYADAKKLAKNVNEMLTRDKTGKQRGYVVVNEHTNSLLIQASRSDMEQVVELVNKLDRATPQILIEADIVETSKDIARNLGIQWGGRYTTGGALKIGKNQGFVTPGGSSQGTFSYDGKGNVTGATVVPTPIFGPGNSGNGFAVNFPAKMNSEAGAALGLMFGTLGENMLEMQLTALEASGKINIISRPSITTLDNQTAFTESGTKVPYASVNNDGETTVKFEDAVLKLEITPHVISDDYLRMKIVVKKDEVDFSSDKMVLGNPSIRKRQTETTLIVKNSETIVISGLSKSVKTDSESGVPFLKDIPALGWFFKGDSTGNNKEEVLIFITPNILQKRMGADLPEAEQRDLPMIEDAEALQAPDK
jgi:type IV pilus assembly protein PilQ